MDINEIKALGISVTEPEEILEKLQELQLDIEERIERVEDEERLAQLRDKLSRVEEQLKAVRKEIESAPKKEAGSGSDRRGAIPIAVDQSEVAAKKSIPVAVTEEEKKAAEKKASENNSNSNNRNFEKEQARKQQQHEEDLKRQAKELSSKMKDKKKQEEKASAQVRKEEEKKAEDTKKEGISDSNDTGGTSSPQKVAMEKKLNDGVQFFYRADFSNARKFLEEVANLGDDVEMEDKDIGIAEHLVGVMYQKGLGGIKKDEDRSVFWFEKAAKHNNVDGCMEYAMYFNSKKSTTANEVKANVRKALKYFKKAAQLGSKDAKSKYVKLVELQIHIVSFGERLQAQNYIDEFIANEQDEFVKKTWRDRKKAIQRRTSSSSEGNGKSVAVGKSESYAAIIGSIIILVGYAYMCKSVFAGRGYLWSFDFLPDLRFLDWSLNIEPFWALCHTLVLTEEWHSLAYGLLLALIGSMLSTFSKYNERGRISNIFCEACFFIGAFIGVVVTLYGMKMGLVYPNAEQTFFLVGLITIGIFAAKAIPYIVLFVITLAL